MGERRENTLINNWKLHQLSRWYEMKYWCCVDAKGYVHTNCNMQKFLQRLTSIHTIPPGPGAIFTAASGPWGDRFVTSWMQSELERCRKENQSWYYHCCHSAPSVFKDGNFLNIPSTFSLSPRRRVALMRQTHASNLPITDVQHCRCVPISHADPRLQSWVCNQRQSTEKTVN